MVSPCLALAAETRARRRSNCLHGGQQQTARLETGNRQLPAMALYRAHGYREIEPFGLYQSDPLSVCFEKRLRIQS